MKLFILFALSFTLGLSYINNNNIKNSCFENILFSIVFGFVTMIAIYEILYVVLFFIKAKLSTLNTIFTIVICIISLANLLRLLKCKQKMIKRIKLKNKKDIPLILLLVAIIVCQIIFLKNYCFYYGYANDEYLYAATSSLALYSNRIISNSGNEISQVYFAHYSLCCWEIFTTWFSWVFRIDIAETLHLYIAMYVVLLVYCVYVLLSIKIFSNSRSRLLFLIISTFLTWYAYYNWISLSGQIIATPWYGRSIMFIIIVPLLFYLLLGMVDKKKLLLTNLVAFAGCSISMTGMITIGFTIGCLLLSNLILKNYKKSLYILLCEVTPVLFLMVYMFTI